MTWNDIWVGTDRGSSMGRIPIPILTPASFQPLHRSLRCSDLKSSTLSHGFVRPKSPDESSASSEDQTPISHVVVWRVMSSLSWSIRRHLMASWIRQRKRDLMVILRDLVTQSNTPGHKDRILKGSAQLCSSKLGSTTGTLHIELHPYRWSGRKGGRCLV